MDNSLGQFVTLVVCLLLPFGWLVAVIWRIRARHREAEIIQRQIATGAYANWDKPPIERRLRLLVLLQLGSLIGFVLALGLLFIFHAVPLLVWTSGVAALVFGVSVILIGNVLYQKVLKGKW